MPQTTFPELSTSNNVADSDAAFHNWYRFILSYPPHLVQHYIARFGLGPEHTLLDPFCGTGTTIIEGAKAGLQTIGLDANPMTFYASKIKTRWDVSPDAVRHFRDRVMTSLYRQTNSTLTLPEASMGLLIKNCISPGPLSLALRLRGEIQGETDRGLRDLGNLALATTTVKEASNLKFCPNVSVSRIKQTAAVWEYWCDLMTTMANDLETNTKMAPVPRPIVRLDDARVMSTVQDDWIDALITSPPYPCEHAYDQHTRLESVILGLYQDKQGIQNVKKTLLTSNSRGVYKADDYLRFVSHIPAITELSARIEARRIELQKTSGFEKLYHRIIEEYFGGMAAHLANLKPKLRPGAKLAYVVGDQHSYFQEPVYTAQLLGDIADRLGYTDVTIETFRQRAATKGSTKMIDENVLLMRWPG